MWSQYQPTLLFSSADARAHRSATYNGNKNTTRLGSQLACPPPHTLSSRYICVRLGKRFLTPLALDTHAFDLKNASAWMGDQSFQDKKRFPSRLWSMPCPGATDVCLTDGDEQSLKLAQENVDANLLQPLPCRQGPRTPAPAGRDPQRQTLDASSTRHSDSDVVSEHVGTSHDAAGGGPGGRRKPSECSATISVRKLRWGREDDMRAACFPGGDGDTGSSSDDSGGCCPWDVVLGSDIAALPYASAYGDLLRTIVSLVNSGKSDGGEGDKVSLPSPREADGAQEEAINGDTRECEEETNRRGDKRRRVVVLLAHKRRHVSEEAFFEDLKEKLGGEKSVREMGEDDIHADFRGTGIRLHMFEVDV